MKNGFTNCVFTKLCYSENTVFLVLSANTAVAVKKMHVIKQKFVKHSGLFLDMAKQVFLFVFLQVLMCLCFFHF